ncbi:MAG: cytochrome c [Pseudomonadota bacterium]
MGRSALGGILAIGLALSAPVFAEEDPAEGQAIFETYCAACHGLDGRGRGPLGALLTVQPTDLTRLTLRNNGTFPLFRVISRIDGRDPLVAHGSAMPVYGDFFEGEDVSLKAASGQPILTSAPIVDLMAFIETLQER